jgi:hypothetical protein
MSKAVVKRSSKSAISLPAHAKEIETKSNFLERAINSCMFLGINVPFIGLAQQTDSLFVLGMSGIISAIAVFTIPNMSGTEPEIRTIGQDINNRFAKVPGFHWFANSTFVNTDNGKNLVIKMKHGKSIIYDITQPNPKVLWDKMYESETGQSVSKDFALFKVS